jgi:hypothetical protein
LRNSLVKEQISLAIVLTRGKPSAAQHRSLRTATWERESLLQRLIGQAITARNGGISLQDIDGCSNTHWWYV